MSKLVKSTWNLKIMHFMVLAAGRRFSYPGGHYRVNLEAFETNLHTELKITVEENVHNSKKAEIEV